MRGIAFVEDESLILYISDKFEHICYASFSSFLIINYSLYKKRLIKRKNIKGRLVFHRLSKFTLDSTVSGTNFPPLVGGETLKKQ